MRIEIKVLLVTVLMVWNGLQLGFFLAKRLKPQEPGLRIEPWEHPNYDSGAGWNPTQIEIKRT